MTRVHYLVGVDPETERFLPFFVEHAPLPVVVDDGAPSLREAYGAETYELVVLDPRGEVAGEPREWVLPEESAALAALIRTLLGAAGPPGGADVVGGPDAGPDAGAADAGRPDGAGDGGGGGGPDVACDTIGAADAADAADAAVPDAGPVPDADRDAAPPPDGPRDAVAPDAAPDVPRPTDVPGDPLAGFALPDRNPRSPWYGRDVGPSELLGAVYFLYFASAG